MKKSLFFLLCFSLAIPVVAQNQVKFLLFADLHYDLIPDGASRLSSIFEAAQEKKVEFMVNLGDLAAPDEKFNELRDQLASSPVKIFHVLGNHDTDRAGKETFMNFYGMQAPYYYVDNGKFRFIFLDSNFFLDKDGQEKGFDRMNHAHSSKTNIFNQEQIVWLRSTLNTGQICLLFSHAPINDGYSNVIENTEIHKTIVHAKAQGTPIAAVFGGHIHSDNHHVVDGIHYIQVNSVSYIWGGSNFINQDRYPAEVYKKYGVLKYAIPYKQALYAIVEADVQGRIKIKGIRSSFMKPAPDKEKLKTKPYPCSPCIRNKKFSYL